MSTLINPIARTPLILAGALLLLLNSCSKKDKDEPELVPEKQYVLNDMRYFMSNTDHIDTVALSLKDTTLYNAGNTLATTKFAFNFAALEKTSQFQIDHAATLPADIKLDRFKVEVPAELYQDNSFSYAPSKVPFTTDFTTLPYQGKYSDTLTVKVPARSSIVVAKSIQAHQITCSFTAVISEKTTGQTYPVKGIWKGLLRYDNLNIKVTEHSL